MQVNTSVKHLSSATHCSLHISIIWQIGNCIGGNFNIHIWAWSVSPSVQVCVCVGGGGVRKKANSVSLDRCQIFFRLKLATCMLSNPVNSANTYFIYFLTENL